MKNCLNFRMWLMPLMVILLSVGNIINAEAQAVKILTSDPRGGGSDECVYETDDHLHFFLIFKTNVSVNINSIEIEGLSGQVVSESITEYGAMGDGTNTKLAEYTCYLSQSLGHYTQTSNVNGEEQAGINYRIGYTADYADGKVTSTVLNSNISRGIAGAVSGGTTQTTDLFSIYCHKKGSNSVLARKTGNNSEILMNEIYPNPANNHITLEFTASNNSEISISIMNELGQEIKSFKEEGNSGRIVKEMDISSFPKGIYMVLLRSGDEIYSKRFVKL